MKPDAVENVALRCALVSLEHIRDTIPAPPHHRTLNHKEAAALLAELERLRARLAAIEKLARNQLATPRQQLLNGVSQAIRERDDLHALILDHKEPT